jgi:hypothetical protein
MYEDRMDNPWFQRMALIETLTDEEKIQLYKREPGMILACSKIPGVILQKVINGKGTILEQLQLVLNEFITDDIINLLYINTPFQYVREDAYRRLYEKDRAVQIGVDIIRQARKASGN